MLGRVDGISKSAVSLGTNVLEAAGKVSILDALAAAGFMYLLIQIGDKTSQLYNSYTASGQLTSADLDLMARELKGVDELFERAQEESSHETFGSALEKINHALKQYSLAVNRKPQLKELVHIREIHALMVEFRAQVLYLMGQYQTAEKDLLDVIRAGHPHVTTYNLLAHLYHNYLGQTAKAAFYINESLKLDQQQLFTKFYQALQGGKVGEVDLVVNEILDIYHKRKRDNGEYSEAWIRLHHTTPAICVPIMLVKWIELKINEERDAHVLWSAAQELAIFLRENRDKTQHSSRILLAESRIKALLKIASLRKQAELFNVDELAVLPKVGVPVVSEAGNQYYLPYSGEHIDQAFTKLFARGTQTDYLSAENHRDSMALIIRCFAEQGWFAEDNHEQIKLLCDRLKVVKHDIENQELNAEISVICKHPQTIKHFIDHYIKDMGWKPWLQVMPHRNGYCSLLHIACLEQGVTLNVYEYAQDEEHTKLKLDRSWRAEGDHKPVLSVVYDKSCDQFHPLHHLSTPSRLYRWLAYSECWNLIKHEEACNQTALEILGARCYATMPQFALAKLNDASLGKRDKDAILAGCQQFIANHDAPHKDDKELMQSIVQNFRGGETNTSSNGLFSRRNIMIGLGLLSAASVVYAANKQFNL